ncbi:MAG: aldo/keto reductase [Thermoplasmata archaeon]
MPGTSLQGSWLGISLLSPVSTTPLSDERTIATLRRAHALGVTTFEIPEGPGYRRSERLLAAAFSEGGTEFVVLVGRSLAALATEDVRGGSVSGDALAGRIRSSLAASAERLAPLRPGVLEWRAEADPSVSPEEDAKLLDGLQAEGVFRAWTHHLPSGAPAPSLEIAGPPRPVALFSAGLSVLEPDLIAPLNGLSEVTSVGCFARDPLGSGRLDGSRFSASIAERRPDTRPPTVRELRRDFDPVLRLGFLTEGRRRTLAQAALQFVGRWPWVCAALVPLPSPDRLPELAEVESVPPLSDAEVERVLSLAHGGIGMRRE